MHDLFIQRIRALSQPLSPLPTREVPVLKILDECQAVIFDIYGTCLISGSGDIGLHAADPKTDALLQALADQGVAFTHEQATEGLTLFYELIRQDHAQTREQGIAFPEVRILEIWERWIAAQGLPLDSAQLAIDVECRLNPVWPMPGLVSCLQALNEKGLQLGIVSNAQIFTPDYFPALTDHSLTQYGFEPDHCVWSWTEKEAKPATRLYQQVLNSFPDLRPDQCLYVGNDMRNDISPASRVGMKTALFAGDQRSLRWREHDPLVGHTRPDLLLTHLDQLTEIFFM